MKLQDYISPLLQKHDCVIVPDFGGFVANYKSADIDKFHKKIYPPSKSVLFNPHLHNNDGLLGNCISQKKAITYQDALTAIGKEVAHWKQQLSDGERIELGELGFLYSNGGKIQFEQSRELNLLLSAYGLQTVDFVDFGSKSVQKSEVVKPKVQIEKTEAEPIRIIEKSVPKEKTVPTIAVEKQEVIEEFPIANKKSATVIRLDANQEIKEVEADQETQENIVPIKRNVFGTIMKYSAAAAIVPLLFYSYWIPMETDALDTQAIQFSDFNPIHNQVQKTYERRDENTVFAEDELPQTWEDLTDNIQSDIYNLKITEEFYISVQLDNVSKVEVDNTNVSVNEIVNTNSDVSGNYHIISGCFSVLENANNLVAELKSQGFNASILDQKGGLHRVSAGSYTDRAAANSGLDQVKGGGFSAWVLKK